MGLKQELKYEFNKILQDVNLSIAKTWETTYKGIVLRVDNSMERERLFIDDQLVDEVIHQSFWDQLKFFSKLTGVITLEDGTTRKVTVILGGLVNLTIRIKVGNKTIFKDKMKLELLPWENKQPIVPYIEAQIKEHGEIISDKLPDNAYIYNYDESIKPGYLDYIGYEEPLPFFEKNLVKHIKKLIDKPTIRRRRIIYEKVMDEYTIMYGAKLIYYIQREQLNEERLKAEALWFLEHATHREVVKFALLLLSLSEAEEDLIDRLHVIALHEEFTVYVLPSLARSRHEGQYKIKELANHLTGWGKVALLHELDAITPKEKKWFLTQSFDDESMNEAAALIIATKAEIDVLLSEDTVGLEDYKRISFTMLQLLKKKAENHWLIDDFYLTPQVLRQYVKHAINFESEAVVQEVMKAIKRYVNQDRAIWDERFEREWSPHEREWLMKELQNLNSFQ